jgi:hypothetical protein
MDVKLFTFRYISAGSPGAERLWVIKIALPARPIEQSAARA